MITENNIFQHGMLINLKITSYEGRKKLDKDQLKDLPDEIVRGVHDLFDKEFKSVLQAIWKYDGETRDYVKGQSVPFPIDGVYFINSNRIEKVVSYLETRREERQTMISNAASEYNEAIERFAAKYPEFYRRARNKYPTKQAFIARFQMRYQFIKMSAPSEDDPFITPEMYQTELRKFRDTIAEMKSEVVATIYQELTELTNRLKEQSTNGKPNQRTFNTTNNFLERVESIYSGFIDRDDIKKVLADVKSSLLGITAENLRDSEAAKKKFADAIKKVAKDINALPDIPMKRALDI